jgi:hypothetical protein
MTVCPNGIQESPGQDQGLESAALDREKLSIECIGLTGHNDLGINHTKHVAGRLDPGSANVEHSSNLSLDGVPNAIQSFQPVFLFRCLSAAGRNRLDIILTTQYSMHRL